MNLGHTGYGMYMYPPAIKWLINDAKYVFFPCLYQFPMAKPKAFEHKHKQSILWHTYLLLPNTTEYLDTTDIMM